MYFITENIEEATKAFEQIGKDETGWIIYYKDKEQKIWEEILIDDRSFKSLLKRQDIPNDLFCMMDIVFLSSDRNDWIGLGYLLSLGDYSYKEIESYIMSNKDKIDKERLYTFSCNFKPIDNREIIGKKYDEICSSYYDYKNTISNIYSLCRN